MNNSRELYDFILDNIQKIRIPDEIAAIGLSISRLELIALLIIARSQAMTMGTLAQTMDIPMSTATGIADRLVKKALLKRGSLPDDRRVVTILLTDTGYAFVDGFQENYHSFIGRIRNVLTEEEFSQGTQLLKKIIMELQKDKLTTDEAAKKQRKKIPIE